MRLVVSLFVMSVMVAAAFAQPVDVEKLQSEIATLKQLVSEKSAELERLNQQLKRLEEILQSVQKKQQSADKTLQRFSGLSIGGYIQMRYRRDTSLPVDAT